MKKIGIVGLKGKWSTETLAESVEKLTGFRLVIEMDKIKVDLSSGKVMYMDHDLTELDGLIIKKLGEHYSYSLLDRIDILVYLNERFGVKVFSPAQSISRLINRLSCTLILKQGDIPIPDTTITEDIDIAIETVKGYGKAILKPLFTSKSRGMIVVEDNESLSGAINNYKTTNPVLYIQKFVPHQGHDLGVCFLGGSYIGTYARVGKKGAWNTTTLMGGQYEAYEPSQQVLAVATKAQGLLELDFTCVDVVESDQGPKVYEISAFGGFKGLKESNDINLADMYAKHVVKKIEG